MKAPGVSKGKRTKDALNRPRQGGRRAVKNEQEIRRVAAQLTPMTRLQFWLSVIGCRLDQWLKSSKNSQKHAIFESKTVDFEKIQPFSQFYHEFR
jgi:hypothetical protein